MAGSTSPATLLHDVVILNEQTRVVWRAGRGSIEHGLIVVAVTPRRGPPAGMLDNPANTFTITASDGGDRGRRFANVTVDRSRSRPPKEWVFA